MAQAHVWTRMAIAAALLPWPVVAAPSSAKPNLLDRKVMVDQVIAANIRSRGGLARLEGIRTQKLHGTITFADGSVHSIGWDLARPARIRTEITFDAGRLIQAYDGTNAWTIDPLGSDRETLPRILAAGEAQNVVAAADMDGPLVNYTKKGNHVSLAGIDTADGRPAYRLDVVTAVGLHDSYYIDTVSHLQTKWLGHRVMNGRHVVYESYFRDYRPIDGVMIAFHIDSQTQGQPARQHISLESVELNAPLPDDEFKMPRSRSTDTSNPRRRSRSSPVRLSRSSEFGPKFLGHWVTDVY